MSAVPVIINGVLMPKTKGSGDQPKPCVLLGALTIQGLEVSGGPIIPETPPSGGDAHPEHPIVIPDPPPSQPEPGLAVVIKPAPTTGGWGLAAKDQKLQWFFVPAQSGAGPKK